MRTVLQVLREFLDPRVVQRGALELHEYDLTSTCPVTKLERSGQAVALRFEPWAYATNVQIPTNRWLFPLFDVRRGEPPVCRSCDYIVFYSPDGPEHQTLFVLLFELKSGKAKGATAQLRNGKLIADYILSVARLHGSTNRWPTSVCFRGVILAGNAPRAKGSIRAPDRAEYIEDSRCGPELRVTTQRPGPSYPIDFFCE